MCMFSGPVASVGDTEIFARLSGKGTQFLVYRMTYESEHETAMILPLPIRLPAKEDGVRFINLEKYDDFFDSLDNAFPYRGSFSIDCGGPESKTASRGSLEMVDVGSYVASFVPTLADFNRLNRRFTLPAEVWDQLPQYSDYGFAVFQLKEGRSTPHPMAFEFETRDENEIFFPTVHVHDGEVHDEEHFDHWLYMQHAGFDSQVDRYVNSNVADSATKAVRSVNTAGQYCNVPKAKGILEENLLLHRKVLSGKLKNVDYRVPVTGHPTNRSTNWRQVRSFVTGWSPWAAIAGCVAWIIARRNRLKRNQLS